MSNLSPPQIRDGLLSLILPFSTEDPVQNNTSVWKCKILIIINVFDAVILVSLYGPEKGSGWVEVFFFIMGIYTCNCEQPQLANLLVPLSEKGMHWLLHSLIASTGK